MRQTSRTHLILRIDTSILNDGIMQQALVQQVMIQPTEEFILQVTILTDVWDLIHQHIM